MYFPYFIAYMTAGLIISALVFLWALKSGQFREQQRARYLPLDPDMGGGPESVSKFHRVHPYLLFGLVFLILLASVVFVVFVLVKSKMMGI
jgi:cbb3-type cytochrome oxidase maturation protein